MDSGECFLVDWVWTLLSCHLGRVVLVTMVVILYKELTMGTYRGKEKLEGKVAIVTGGNTGIGLETARGLAERGARVILGCRNKQRGEAAVSSIISSTGNKMVVCIQLDLLDLKSVRKFADDVTKKEKKVDILVNNAGIAKHPKSLSKGSTLSRDKLEVVTQTNHLSHFLLTNLLAKSLAAAGSARVLNISCQGQTRAGLEFDTLKGEKQAYLDNWEQVYNSTKLMNVLFTRELAAKWKDIGVTSYSLHPGLVRTEIFRNVSPMVKILRYILALSVGKSCVQGAQTSLYLCCQPGLEEWSGRFFSDCRVRNFQMDLETEDKKIAAAANLWTRSQELVKLK